MLKYKRYILGFERKEKQMKKIFLFFGIGFLFLFAGAFEVTKLRTFQLLGELTYQVETEKRSLL